MKLTVAPAPHLRRAGLVITIVSLAAIGLATLLPGPPMESGSHFCLICGAFGGVNAVLNILLFIPLGIGLAFSELPTKRALLTMCALSALIETAQLTVIAGRDATIGDVLTNTLGGALGFAIGRYAEQLLRPPPRIALNLTVGWAMIWLAIQTVSGFGFGLSLPDSQYYGQLGRAFENHAVFPGRVLSASIDGVQIPNTRLADSRRVQWLLINGATVATTVAPAEPTRDIAPIARVADGRNKEIVLLAQNGEDLIFGVHTGAAVLRLHSPLFAVPDAFPTGASRLTPAPATLTLSGRYLASRINIRAQSRSAPTHDGTIPVTISMGWTLWLPFQWFIEGTRAELVVGWLWLACLAIPVGYWCFRIVDSSESLGLFGQWVTWVPSLVAGIAFLCAGLIIVPITFGVSATPLGDWLATLAGILTGLGVRALTNKPCVPQG
jgi:hypothetical protein